MVKPNTTSLERSDEGRHIHSSPQPRLSKLHIPVQSVEEDPVQSPCTPDRHVACDSPLFDSESPGSRPHPMVEKSRNSDYADVNQHTNDIPASTTQGTRDEGVSQEDSHECKPHERKSARPRSPISTLPATDETDATKCGDTGVEPGEHPPGSRTTEHIVGHHRNTSTQSPSSTSTRSTHNTDGGTEGTAYDEEEGTDGPKESSATTGLPPFREHSHSDDE